MPRNQYFGTKMPLAQQALEMLPSNASDEGKGSIADVNLCCRLSLEARRHGKTSIEVLASPVLIRSQNDEIERVSFFRHRLASRSGGRWYLPRTSAADGGLELKWRRNNVEQISFGPIISREDE